MDVMALMNEISRYLANPQSCENPGLRRWLLTRVQLHLDEGISEYSLEELECAKRDLEAAEAACNAPKRR